MDVQEGQQLSQHVCVIGLVSVAALMSAAAMADLPCNIAHIPNPEPQSGDWFGASVAVSGDVALIGAHLSNPGGIVNVGSAYIFRYDGSGWLLEQAIPNPELAVDDFFGSSVAIDGDVAVVGAYGDDPGTDGSAYVIQLQFPQADLNCDELADGADFVIFHDCLEGPEVTVEGDCAVADLTGDGDVDLEDFAQVQNAFAP